MELLHSIPFFKRHSELQTSDTKALMHFEDLYQTA